MPVGQVIGPVRPAAFFAGEAKAVGRLAAMPYALVYENFSIKMKITARNVAERCGTSPAAVSRAFRAEGVIAPDLRARILAVSRELGYAPPTKRGRRQAGRSTYSVVVGDITNPFYPATLEQLSQDIRDRNSDMVVRIVPPGESVDSVISDVLQGDFDAVIIMSANLSSDLARQCQRRGLPVVLFNRIQTDPSTYAVCADNYNGARMVADRLVSRGCRAPAFLGGIADTSTHLERRRGFLDGLSAHDATPVFEGNARYDYKIAFRLARDLFDSSLQPDGLFCANDIMAIAAIDAAKSLGLAVGHDVSIIGFDDIPMAAWTSYRLTTVRQRTAAMVQATLGLIDEARQTAEGIGAIRIVRGDLVARDSG